LTFFYFLSGVHILPSNCCVIACVAFGKIFRGKCSRFSHAPWGFNVISSDLHSLIQTKKLIHSPSCCKTVIQAHWGLMDGSGNKAKIWFSFWRLLESCVSYEFSMWHFCFHCRLSKLPSSSEAKNLQQKPLSLYSDWLIHMTQLMNRKNLKAIMQRSNQIRIYENTLARELIKVNEDCHRVM